MTRPVEFRGNSTGRWSESSDTLALIERQPKLWIDTYIPSPTLGQMPGSHYTGAGGRHSHHSLTNSHSPTNKNRHRSSGGSSTAYSHQFTTSSYTSQPYPASTNYTSQPYSPSNYSQPYSSSGYSQTYPGSNYTRHQYTASIESNIRNLRDVIPLSAIQFGDSSTVGSIGRTPSQHKTSRIGRNQSLEKTSKPKLTIDTKLSNSKRDILAKPLPQLPSTHTTTDKYSWDAIVSNIDAIRNSMKQWDEIHSASPDRYEFDFDAIFSSMEDTTASLDDCLQLTNPSLASPIGIPPSPKLPSPKHKYYKRFFRST
ncbi:hypothetical protein TRVA0_001S02300 [Trichomonascus vanleenenianus]|uniref:uncharacterized protein n=1 Tax=Trichomonascus vanleenenianus TaxID=2268995 RepID=UPI003ECB98F2